MWYGLDMTKHQRTLLFFSLLGIFLLASPVMILYSQGYRINWQNLKITNTGAIYLKISPARADVSLDAEPMRRTDLLFGSLLISNLFPGEHLIEIMKEGYQSWKKILPVTSKNVTEAKNILLFKNDISFQPITDGVLDAWFSPDQKLAVLKKQNGKSWKATLLNLDTNGEDPLFSSQNSKNDFLGVTWSASGKRFIAKTANGESLQYAVWGTTKGDVCFLNPCAKNIIPESADNVIFSPTSSDALLYILFSGTNNMLFQGQYTPKESSTKIAENIDTFTVKENDVVWIDSRGSLWQESLSSGNIPKAISIGSATIIAEVAKQLWSVGESVVFLQDNQLTVLSSLFKQKTFTADLISPNLEGTEIALAKQGEISLLNFKENKGLAPKQAGSKTILLKSIVPITHLAWLDQAHILFSTDSSIQVIETDGRNHANIANIGTFTNPTFFWKDSINALYVLSKGTLSLSETIK